MANTRTASWLPFIIVALSLAAGAMGTGLASPLYPLYEQAWRIPHSTTTVIFVVYMVGVLAAFLCLGRLSNHIGPVIVLRAALVIVLLGLGASAVADGVATLSVGRTLIGIASGMITTAGTTGLLQIEPGGPRRAPLVASMTTMAGFGAGPLVAGLVAQFAPAPLVTPYLVVIVAIAIILVGLCFVRTALPVRVGARLSLLPKLGFPHAGARPGFLVASFSTFSAFALFSLLAALAPSFLGALLPWHGPAVSGTAIGAVLLCSALVQLPARRLPPRRCLPIALCVMTAGVLLLAAAMETGGPVLFIVAIVTIGVGHGLIFMSGLVVINTVARQEHHAGILATFLSIAYLGTIAPILGVGYLADHVGLASAVVVFCLAFAAFCLLLFAFARTALDPERLAQTE
ncbi:MFS transporter [Pseudolabrys taiwanensis]|uniref:MFS transporter n=1 Tax=Pseudolabrys taiwanensis TaxID=331696 RepID=A0A345ZSU8_9HYPH|nr:MFS transporter [Pseudolabrys taiwanensis]AXK79995.1 MFS transporter [Pseudolabrys taiwanensis]